MALSDVPIALGSPMGREAHLRMSATEHKTNETPEERDLFPFHEPEEHPTPNIEWQRASSLTSMFGVRCWTFDVFPRFCTQHRMGFGQSSFEPMLAWKVLPNNPENAGRPYQSQRLSKGNYSVTLIRRNASKCLVSSSIRFKSRLLNETQSRNCRLSSRFLSEFR